MKIGYARVSTGEQSIDRQADELRAAGCDRLFQEVASGRRGANRPEWQACLDHLRAGDTLMVGELSRLGRNVGELGRLIDDLDEKGASLRRGVARRSRRVSDRVAIVLFDQLLEAAASRDPAVLERDDAGSDLEVGVVMHDGQPVLAGQHCGEQVSDADSSVLSGPC